MSTEVVLKVDMMCQGCVGAVTRVLGKMEGVDSFDVSLEKQQAVVRGKALNAQEVLEKVTKTGKKAELVSS